MPSCLHTTPTARAVGLAALLLLPAAGCLDEGAVMPVAPMPAGSAGGLPVLRPGGTAPAFVAGGQAPAYRGDGAAPASLRAAIGTRVLARAAGSAREAGARWASDVTGAGAPPALSVASSAATATAISGGADADAVNNTSHFLLENTTTGERAVWVVSNGTIVQAVSLGVVPIGWHIKGGRDFNNDRYEDVLWENSLTREVALWLMDGTARVIAAVSLGLLPANWRVAGALDYDDDGNTDILFQNGATGERAVWLMNGSGGVAAAFPIGIVDPEWLMTAARDMTNDGQDDILLRHATGGSVVLWTVGGGRTFNASVLSAVPSEWSLIGTGLIDGGNNVDVLWENTSTGQRAAWLMNGAGAILSTPTLTVEPNTAWHLGAVLEPAVPPVDPCDVGAARPIYVGQTLSGAISSSDCAFTDGTRFDLYRLVLHERATVQFDMTSTAVDARVILYNVSRAVILTANGGGSGTDARTATVLNAGIYYIGAHAFNGAVGAYQLALRSPSIVTANTATIMATMVGTAPPDLPSVLVRNQAGAPIAGATVTFALTAGDGSIGGATATTDANGMATLGSWLTGATPGPNVVTATVSGVEDVFNNPIVFSAGGCTGGGSSTSYGITVCFMTSMTAAQQATFANAAARWAQLITGDETDLVINAGQNVCGARINMNVDDLAIFARVEPIDGPGAVLGSAGPCLIRSADTVSIVGSMRFDVADVANLEASGRFQDVILHEMGHVIGIGTLWNLKRFLRNPSPVGGPAQDTHMNGPQAIIGFDEIGGTSYTGAARPPSLPQQCATLPCAKVPVENMFGGGTINSHWRESVFDNELMTGFLESAAGVTNPLSKMTVRSLADLGYAVNPDLADAYTMTFSLRADAGVWSDGIQLLDDIDQGPIFTIDSRNRMTRVR